MQRAAHGLLPAVAQPSTRPSASGSRSSTKQTASSAANSAGRVPMTRSASGAAAASRSANCCGPAVPTTTPGISKSAVRRGREFDVAAGRCGSRVDPQHVDGSGVRRDPADHALAAAEAKHVGFAEQSGRIVLDAEVGALPPRVAAHCGAQPARAPRDPAPRRPR